MALPNIFSVDVKNGLVDRINQLSVDSNPNWGKMTVSQMFAHCNVAYKMMLSKDYPKSKGLKLWLLKTFVKPGVVNEKPYPKNSRTAPQFIIKDERNFDEEKKTLVQNLNTCVNLGRSHFDGIVSPSFGPLSAEESNNLFYKHLDHHLTQFGV